MLPKEKVRPTIQFNCHTEVAAFLRGQIVGLKVALENATENDPIEDLQEMAMNALMALNLLDALMEMFPDESRAAA